MDKMAQVVHSTTTNTQESETASRRPPSARQATPMPGLANSPALRLNSMVDMSRMAKQAAERMRNQKFAKQINQWQLSERQQVTYQVLINRFGRDVGLSMHSYRKVAEGRASVAENRDYQKKSEALAQRVQKFYREFDVAKMDNVRDRDLNVLISMLSTGFDVTQNQTTHITKVMNNKGLDMRLVNAISNKPVSVGGFIGSSEATEALSPQQQITALGLDYEIVDKKSEKQEKRTDFLLQAGTDAKGKPKYVPIPQTGYIKIPYTKQLKALTLMTLDVRLYEKILERANRAIPAEGYYSLEDETITAMAKEISMKPVCLKYKISDNESEKDVSAKVDKYNEKYEDKGKVTADKPPFTGLGFSAYGEKIGSGFMNMYPEMNISVRLDEKNFNHYVGANNHVEFYTKFAKTNKNLGTSSPDGSTDILVGKWDGKEVTIPVGAQEKYENNLLRVKKQFSNNKKNVDALEDNKFPMAKIQDELVKAKAKLAEMNNKLAVVKSAS